MKAAVGEYILGFCLWMKKQLSIDRFEEFAMHGWAVWKERQKFLHRKGEKSLAITICWSESLVADFRKCSKRVAVNEEDKSGNRETKWKPPTERLLKLNTDACVNESLNRYSIAG